MGYGRWLVVCVWVSLAAAVTACAPPPARWFHTREEPEPIRGDKRANHVLKEVQRQLVTAVPAGLEGDGRLADLALEIADDAEAERDALDGTRLAILSRARGLVNPLPQVVFAVGTTLEEAGEKVLQKGLVWAPEFESTHYGLAATRRGKRWAAVLVLDTRPVELAPLPVSMDSPGTVTIDARLRSDLIEPGLVITQPNGTVEKPEPDPTTRRVQTKLPLTKGLWGIEVIGSGEHGPMVVANVAIAEGVPVPRDVPSELTRPKSAGEVASELSRLIDQDRKGHGLLPLRTSPELAKVALSHSLDMRKGRFFGHTSPTTGGPQDRTAAAGVPAWNLRENVARGYTAREIHTLLMLSPAHRAAILSPEVDQLGVGVAAESEGKRAVFFATELFAHAPVTLVAETETARLFTRVSELRKLRKLPPLVRSKSLDLAASRAAAEYFQRPAADGETLLTAGIRSVIEPPDIKLIRAAMFLDVEADALPLSTELLEGHARFVGIGVVQGTDARLGPDGVVWVVIVAK